MAAIPSSAPAAILDGPYGEPYAIRQHPVPRPLASQALVRFAFAGVCHGDLYDRRGGGPSPATPIRPLIGGHEGIGTIVAFGEGAAGNAHNADFVIGDVVGIARRCFVCGTCEPCRLGAENFCERQQVTGMHRDGTFQTFVSFPTAELIRIPKGLDLAQACPILCAGVTAYTSLRIMSPQPGKWCAVVGAAGGLGHLAIQYAKILGLKVLAIDGGQSGKERFCMMQGADAFVDFTKDHLVETVQDITHGGADYVLVLSPNQSSYNDAGNYSRFGAQIMGVGIGNAHMPLRLVLQRNLIVRCNQTGTKADIEEALQISVSKQVVCEVEHMSLKDLNVALDRLEKGQVTGRLVLDLSGDSSSMSIQDKSNL